MSALSELDEYISRNEPAVSFAHTGRSSFEQRPAQKESFHHSALLSDVDGLLESLAARRNRKARELRNLQRLAELDDVTDGDDFTARSFSMTLSPTLSSPRRDRDDSGDSLDLKPYLTRHAEDERSPPRRYRKPGQSKLYRSREYAELRASVDEHLPDSKAAWITHPAPSATSSPPRATTAAAATRADERHGADGQSFAAFERYLDTQAHMLRELTNSITTLQQNLSARSADASVSAAAAAGARSADRSVSISGSIVDDQDETNGWEPRQQPPQLSSSFQKQSPSVSFALPATYHTSSRAAANTNYSAEGRGSDANYSSHRGWKSSHQPSHLPGPGESRYRTRPTLTATDSRSTGGATAYFSSTDPESRVHAGAPLSAFSTSQPDDVNSIAISSRRPVRRRHQLPESVLNVEPFSMAPPSLRSSSRRAYTQPVAHRPVTTTTTSTTIMDTQWRSDVQTSRPQTPTTEPHFGGTPSPDSVEPAAAATRTDIQADTLYDRYASSAEQSASQRSARSSSISSRSSSSERRRAFIQVHSSPEQAPLRPAPRPAVVDQGIQAKAEPDILRTSVATTGVQTSASVASSSSSTTYRGSHVSEPSAMTAARSQPDDSSVGTITSHSSASVRSRSDPRHSSISVSSVRAESAQPQQDVREAPAAAESSIRVERPSQSRPQAQPPAQVQQQQQQSRPPPPPPARPPPPPPPRSTQTDPVNQPSNLPEANLDLPRRTGIQAPKITHMSARTEQPTRHQYGAVANTKYSEHVQYDELPPFEERRARFEQPVLRPATSPQYPNKTSESRAEQPRMAHFAGVASLEESIMSDDSTDAPPESVTRWKSQHEELLKDMQKLSEDIDSVLRGRPPRPNGSAPTRTSHHFRSNSTAPAGAVVLPHEETSRYMPGPLPLWATSPVRPRNDDDGDHGSTASRDSLNEATGVIGELLKSAP